MRLTHVAGVLAGTALLSAALPVAAQAADGPLIWSNHSGSESVISDPASGQCGNVHMEPQGGVYNATDRPVVVFDQPNCSGNAQKIPAGQQTPPAAWQSFMVAPE
jgi:hypothetical protein